MTPAFGPTASALGPTNVALGPTIPALGPTNVALGPTIPALGPTNVALDSTTVGPASIPPGTQEPRVRHATLTVVTTLSTGEEPA